MPFRLADWKKMLRRLAFAREQLARFAADPDDRNSLDMAVISIWTVAEYAVNVLLELRGMKKEQWHRMHDRADELRAGGTLRGDYGKRLEQLEGYRLTAGYAGYVRNASVHYSRRNVEDCLTSIEELCAEVEAALRDARKLP